MMGIRQKIALWICPELEAAQVAQSRPLRLTSEKYGHELIVIAGRFERNQGLPVSVGNLCAAMHPDLNEADAHLVVRTVSRIRAGQQHGCHASTLKKAERLFASAEDRRLHRANLNISSNRRMPHDA